ncbi:MAG: inositol monophosphatase family protein, partial [Alphaproteobacteria bacterium]|nr:inositol monophosphatase family protein [Alphaproteobacteria bacterium]
AYNTSDARPLVGSVRRTGCPALDLAWVAAGKFDAFVSDPLDFAEIAAGDLIVREAGGTIEMMADLIASNGKIEF